jgi:transmembrane sensor
VQARNAIGTDVGTRFDVRAYLADSAVRIVVEDGAVDVRLACAARRVCRAYKSSFDDHHPLHAGDIAVIQSDTVQISHRASVADLIAWTRGDLAFRGTPLAAVLTELGRWYDLDLYAGDANLAGHAITGSFRDESATEMLDAIAALADARYVRDGRRVTFLAKAGPIPKSR